MCAVCVFSVGGVRSVKGTHAQTRLSLGITLAYSSPLLTGKGGGVFVSTIAPEAFIMGQFVFFLFLLSAAINTARLHIYSHTGRYSNREKGIDSL